MLIFSFLVFICDTVTIFGPSIGYGIQIFEIERFKSSEGFAPQVSLIVMISMVARIFFWLAKRFAYQLLFQAIFLYVTQVYQTEKYFL